MKGAIISLSEIGTDPRPSRVATALSNRYDVSCVGLGKGTTCPHRYITIPSRTSTYAPVKNRLYKGLRTLRINTGQNRAAFKTDPYLSQCRAVISTLNADVAWVHDLELLPLAIECPGIRRVIFDAREYYPAQHEESLKWRFTDARQMRYLVQTYLPQADTIVTVSGSLSRQYQNDCGVNCVYLPSYPLRSNLKVITTSDETIRLVYHGKAHENRKCESLINLMKILGHKYHLTMMLVGGRSGYLKKLNQLAYTTGNVSLSAPVPMESIAESTNSFDIGICAIPPTTFNLRHCLPNKLFEMIQARLAVVSWPSPDIAEVIRRHDIGEVADDFSLAALAIAIRKLTIDDINRFKLNSHHASHTLSFETTRQQIVDITESALASNSLNAA